MKTPPKIRAFIWDLGGVVLRAGDPTPQEPLAIRLSAAPQPNSSVEHVLIDFIRVLRHNYRTALLIHNWGDLTRAYANLWQFEDAFDEIFVASEPNLWKPTPPVFSQALSQLGALADETVVIDDDPQNVQAARNAGLYAIRYENPAQTGSTLLELLAEQVY